MRDTRDWEGVTHGVEKLEQRVRPRRQTVVEVVPEPAKFTLVTNGRKGDTTDIGHRRAFRESGDAFLEGHPMADPCHSP
jgi:hypothetical protein